MRLGARDVKRKRDYTSKLQQTGTQKCGKSLAEILVVLRPDTYCLADRREDAR